MAKILALGIIVVLIALGIGSSKSGFNPLTINPQNINKETIVENFQMAKRSLEEKLNEKATGVVKGVQADATSYLMKQTGRQIIELLKTLPPEQQQEIKKGYCGEQ